MDIIRLGTTRQVLLSFLRPLSRPVILAMLVLTDEAKIVKKSKILVWFACIMLLTGCDEDRFKVKTKKRKVDVTKRFRAAAPLTKASFKTLVMSAKKAAAPPKRRPVSRPSSQATSRATSKVVTKKTTHAPQETPPKNLYLRASAGHVEAIRALGVVSSGLYAWSGGDDRTLIKWKLPALTPVKTLRSTKGRVRAIAVGPTGRRMVTLEGEGHLSLRDADGRVLRSSESPVALSGMQFARLDNKLLAISKGGELLTFHGTSLALQARVKGCPKGGATALHTDRFQALVAVVCGDGQLWLSTYDGKVNKLLKTKKKILGVSIAPDGLHFAVSTEDAAITVWKVHSKALDVQQVARGYGHVREANVLHFSRDGRTLLTAGVGRTIALWKVTAKALTLQRYLQHEGAVTGAFFLPDNKHILAVDTASNVRLWKRNGESAKTIQGPKIRSVSMSFSADGLSLTTADQRKIFSIWDLRKGQRHIVFGIHPNHLIRVQHAFDAKHLLAVDPDNAVFWDLKQRRTIDLIRPPVNDTISAAALGRDWTEVLIGTTQHGVQLWTIRGGPTRIYRHRKPQGVTSLDVHALSRRAVVGTMEPKIYIYNLQQFQLLKEIDLSKLTPKPPKGLFVRLVRMSSDGKQFVVLAGRQAWVLSTKDAKVLATYQHTATLHSAAFSSDGTMLALGSSDQQVHVMSLGDKKITTRLSGCRSTVGGLVWSAKHPVIVGACHNGARIFWHAKTKQSIVAIRPLGKTDWLTYTKDLSFAGSAGALKHVSFSNGTKTFPLTAFGGRFFQPTKVQKIFQTTFPPRKTQTP